MINSSWLHLGSNEHVRLAIYSRVEMMDPLVRIRLAFMELKGLMKSNVAQQRRG